MNILVYDPTKIQNLGKLNFTFSCVVVSTGSDVFQRNFLVL